LPDGNVEYLSRIDFQVKIRGLRIEIGEIESVLSLHSAVREVVVVAREDVPGDKRLVAYLVSKHQATLNIDEIRNFLKEKLADYMVPSAFVQLDVFPLTSSGKVDRRALPEPEKKRQTETAYVAPRGYIERTITGVWQELLQIDKVGVNDNFFDLGGHSLLLIRVMNKLQEMFNKELSIVYMFLHPTIKDLARLVTKEKEEETSFEKVFDRAQKQKEILRRRKQNDARRRTPNE
jgi:acyl carrier protein